MYKKLIPVFLIFILLVAGCKKNEGYPPVVTTVAAAMIGQRTATAGGLVTDSRGFEILAFGVCWDTSSHPTIQDKHTTQTGNSASFQSNLNGLIPGQSYYLRAYATSKGGTGYGDEETFETDGIHLPEPYTLSLSYINANSVVCQSELLSDGGGVISARGVCWSKSENPTLADSHSNDGTGSESYYTHISALTGASKYYIRAYATNETGTAYGNSLSFTTLADSDAIIYYPITFKPGTVYGSVTDADFNVYKTLTLGTQTWMAENLRTTHYVGGAQIANPGNLSYWDNINSGCWSWYNNDTLFTKINGTLYNWLAVNSGQLCPAGWHVPTESEFSVLISYLGGEETAGGKLKETGTHHWTVQTAGADNSSGFSAVAAGCIRAANFNSLYTSCLFWTSTESNMDNAGFVTLSSSSDSARIDTGSKKAGYSVRCIKNN
jgi:uncharacterized protein (TIGR02145 family)